jgi:hypothetical protein
MAMMPLGCLVRSRWKKSRKRMPSGFAAPGFSEALICPGFLGVGGLESGGDLWLLVLVLVFGGGEHV